MQVLFAVFIKFYNYNKWVMIGHSIFMIHCTVSFIAFLDKKGIQWTVYNISSLCGQLRFYLLSYKPINGAFSIRLQHLFAIRNFLLVEAVFSSLTTAEIKNSATFPIDISDISQNNSSIHILFDLTKAAWSIHRGN